MSNRTYTADQDPTLRPADEFNRALREAVHPTDWSNPSPADRYHLVVIGGGTAGLVCAAGAAGLGARVALVEEKLLGGDCLNSGCVPSKALISAARAWHACSHAKHFGAAEIAGDGDFPLAMQRMRRLRAQIAPHDSAARFRDLGVDVFLGRGRFLNNTTVSVGQTQLKFRRAVVATGGHAWAPPIPGLSEAHYLTNETVFSLEERPTRLTVLGGGPIGCEMAQTFARLGSAVTLIDTADHIMPREDRDAAAVVAASLRRDGVRILTGTSVERIEQRTGRNGSQTILNCSTNGAVTNGTVTDGTVNNAASGTGDSASTTATSESRLEVVGDELLVAVGRRPNVEGLGLEDAGVRFDTTTGVAVDDRLRTTNPRIYAAGDVASRFQFTHAADALARIVIQNALFFGRARASNLVIPWCTYTSPEVAHVGLSEHSASEQGTAVDIIRIDLSDVDRSILEEETDGFLKILVQQGGDRILGATMVAPHAGETLGELSLAITQGIGLSRIASTIHAYPTTAEAIKKAADAWRRTKLTPTTKSILARYFRWIR